MKHVDWHPSWDRPFGPFGRILPVLKSMSDVICEGFDEIGEDGAVAGLDEGFDGHSWDERLAVEPGDLGLGNGEPHLIIGQAGR